MGILFLENKNSSIKRFKKVFIKLAEKYELFNALHNEWAKKSKTLSIYPVKHPENIEPGQILKIPFRIMIPNIMVKRTSLIREWRIFLKFVQKTGMISSSGTDKEQATCMLPFEGSDYTPSFGGRIKESVTEAKKLVDFQNWKYDFSTERLCPACSEKTVKTNKFCGLCGVDLSNIPPLEDAEVKLKQLVITALTDTFTYNRIDAVQDIGTYKDIRTLGVLTHIVLKDPDEEVRKEAADKLGDIHHPYSLNALTKALEDSSPIVRKEAIEGLKKLKEKNP